MISTTIGYDFPNWVWGIGPTQEKEVGITELHTHA